MIPRFTVHAREQMACRDITEDDVRSVLEHFHDSQPGGTDTTVRYIGYVGVGTRILNVIAERPGVALDPVKL